MGRMKKILECVGHGLTIAITALDTYVEYRKFQSNQKKKNKKEKRRGRKDGKKL